MIRKKGKTTNFLFALNHRKREFQMQTSLSRMKKARYFIT